MRAILLNQHWLRFSQNALSALPTIFCSRFVFSSTLADYHRHCMTCKIFLLLGGQLEAFFCSARVRAGIRSVRAGRKNANLKGGATHCVGRFPIFPAPGTEIPRVSLDCP